MSLSKYLILGLVGVVLGMSANGAAAEVVAVVSAQSPVTALNQHQLMDIFLGKLNRFPNGQPAVPVDQVDGAPARDEFYRTFSGKTAAQVRAYWAKIIFTGRGHPPAAVENDAEVKQMLAANPNAVGYIDRSAVDGTVRVLQVD